ncbi:hypothetical protein, conserved [Eimeria necatrix]|uniref:Uncharacterized protein n=1 Tax=Eimeria necatrix TaxID=51315 RepID=U6MRG8_9EIME|nr:hypothetical protein, conserved [Eimeria necatrix]CDJ64260.1 hypothetical protein, conserved [Eimeria necatrix]
MRGPVPQLLHCLFLLLLLLLLLQHSPAGCRSLKRSRLKNVPLPLSDGAAAAAATAAAAKAAAKSAAAAAAAAAAACMRLAFRCSTTGPPAAAGPLWTSPTKLDSSSPTLPLTTRRPICCRRESRRHSGLYRRGGAWESSRHKNDCRRSSRWHSNRPERSEKDRERLAYLHQTRRQRHLAAAVCMRRPIRICLSRPPAAPPGGYMITSVYPEAQVKFITDTTRTPMTDQGALKGLFPTRKFQSRGSVLQYRKAIRWRHPRLYHHEEGKPLPEGHIRAPQPIP